MWTNNTVVRWIVYAATYLIGVGADLHCGKGNQLLHIVILVYAKSNFRK